MPRHIIVDGYNFGWRLAAAGAAKNNPLLLRKLVPQRLAHLAGFIAEEITVVFDGTGPGPEPQESNGAVKVIFSGADCSADTIIEKMAFAAENPSDILVVTSDRMERTTAAGSGVETISAGGFLEMLESCEKQLADALARKRAARPFTSSLNEAFPPDFTPPKNG